MRSTSVFFLGTSTGFAIHVSFLVSQMNWASSNRLTSSPIALRFGSEKRLRACFTGFVFGLIRRACSRICVVCQACQLGTRKIFPTLLGRRRLRQLPAPLASGRTRELFCPG